MNDLLDFAREVRRLCDAYPESVEGYADIMQHADKLASHLGGAFVEIVLDHEERIGGFWAKWKRWRNKREFIKRIARPNVTFLGHGKTPKPGKKARAKPEPEIEMVGRVTIEHGLAFAQGWYDGEGDMTDACSGTEIMTWPDDDDEQKEVRFHDLADEICAKVFTLTKRQIAEAFVTAASEVLDRERGK